MLQIINYKGSKDLIKELETCREDNVKLIKLELTIGKSVSIWLRVTGRYSIPIEFSICKYSEWSTKYLVWLYEMALCKLPEYKQRAYSSQGYSAHNHIHSNGIHFCEKMISQHKNPYLDWT
jgi:hypothetical protein